jgi:benzoyl-CoA reductase subunit C
MQNILHDPQQLVADWKAQGKKVVGYRCIYVPEEIIYAADMMPFPLFGTPEAIGVADSYFQSCACEFIRNIFDHALDGKLKFLDGLVLANTCDHVRKLYDHWNTYIKTPCYIINNPQKLCTPDNYNYYRKELERFKAWAEEFSGSQLTDESLQDAICLYNENKALLRELYFLRKNAPPLISGEEAMDIVMASMLMPKEKCNPLLRQLLEEVKAREAPQASSPRILITGSIIDNPALIRMVDEVGGMVVADDLCTTTKYFWHEIKKDKDPLDALYRYNNERCLCSCMHPTEARFDYLWELVEEFSVEGVIYFNLKYCHPFLYEAPLYRKKLQAQGIPTIFLEAGHDLSGIGQLRTRVQAFIEMLG